MTRHALLASTFCASAMSVLMAACSSEDGFTHEADESIALSPTVAFTVVDDFGSSRGLPVDRIEDLKDFRADVYLHRGGSSSPYFANERQYRANGMYRSDHAYLWPHLPGDQLAVVAVAPYSIARNLTISEAGSFTYTVPDSAVSQPDLMFATASDVDCARDADNQRTPVPLRFRHLLTKVRFVFGKDVSDYWRLLTVHSVKVENVAATGTWDPTADNGNGGWNITNDTQTHSCEIIAAVDSGVPPGTGKRPYGEGEKEMWEKEYTMFLLPQTLPDGARVVVDMSHRVSNADNSLQRSTYYIYLDGKRLRPGHTVTVEINSNYTYDCTVEMVHQDSSIPETAIRPLSANASTYQFKIIWSGGGDAMKVKVADESMPFAKISSDGTTPADSCFANSSFFLHTFDNDSEGDRFIRLILYPGHGSSSEHEHLVVLKQRGKTSGYGDFDDIPGYVDSPQSWGFNWPTPFTVAVDYEYPFAANLAYTQDFRSFTQGWSSCEGSIITLDYSILKSRVRVPNSPSDGLANTIAINNHCFFLNPFGALHYLWEGISGEVRVNNVPIDNLDALSLYESSAVREVLGQNPHTSISNYGGFTGTEHIESSNIEVYLPAVEQLETIAATEDNPLVAGRTYWSSTLDTNGNPIALTINADGTTTRSTPGADTSAYVHPVRGSGQNNAAPSNLRPKRRPLHRGR